MNFDKICWRFYFEDGAAVDPDALFRVFNTWIPNSKEIFVDVADYQHVRDGIQTILVGHYVDYALDDTGRRRGLLYSRKRGIDGAVRARIQATLAEMLTACARLESDPAFGGNLRFRTDTAVFLVNDRGLAPNTDETFAAIRPELDAVLKKVFGHSDFVLERDGRPRERFTVHITRDRNEPINALLDRL